MHNLNLHLIINKIAKISSSIARTASNFQFNLTFDPRLGFKTSKVLINLIENDNFRIYADKPRIFLKNQL